MDKGTRAEEIKCVRPSPEVFMLTDSRVQRELRSGNGRRGHGSCYVRSRELIRPSMGPKSKRLIREALLVLGVLAILSLLAQGQLAATVLVMVPMVFLAFGRRPD